ncbi:MAG TPA: hypothetical protein VFX76_00630 [Roseiflexaceae bacterium]|nr:hypothetical protein [Roseiflexaceae bacterium]
MTEKTDEPQALESMSCEELLREMARLTSERDHVQSQVATPAQADPDQAGQVVHMIDQGERIERIGELLKAKGCQ